MWISADSACLVPSNAAIKVSHNQQQTDKAGVIGIENESDDSYEKSSISCK